MPFVARLKGRSELFLLAEPGLLEGAANTAFNPAGRCLEIAYERFAAELEEEIELDSGDLTAEQRAAFTEYWQEMEAKARRRQTAEVLQAHASKHPVRYDAERRGGVFLREDTYPWADAIARLDEWLRHAADEDVIGDIGTYARKAWIKTSLPGRDGELIGLQINADTRAEPVARFLAFVDGCGGYASVRAERTGREIIFWSADGTEHFGSTDFYCYERPLTRCER
ncbi:hypothetical protein [Corallococcus aberystwythensis]|uniref:Uncharacterized protein n=1 Tax=Corallococcus aberystwythensis TaxID=2316722 RepID=A0A3A8Q9Q6_9BACT|nr:hypothetical protein [Corallococcus aberystwythensis]RKH63750.1 hypothetical protein D7W81_19810 [Corallococcus aberystwythensis]